MSATRKLPFNLMTVERFIAWCPDGEQWELVDGEARAMAPTRVGHGALQAALGASLFNHLAERRSGCTLVTAPGVIPRVRAAANFRIPDLGVTCAPLAANDTHMPEPVLLVEILSPSNEADTWSNVWTYTTIPSVQEILVLHTREQRAELLRRQPDGGWPTDTTQLVEGDLVLESIGFRTPLAALYRTVPGLA